MCTLVYPLTYMYFYPPIPQYPPLPTPPDISVCERKLGDMPGVMLETPYAAIATHCDDMPPDASHAEAGDGPPGDDLTAADDTALT